MLILRFLFVLLILAINSLVAYSQGVPIGAWRHHMPTNNIIKIVDTNDDIIGATEYGLVVYNRKDNRVLLFNKVHGLSDFGISCLEYISDHKIVFVGYQNGNIDIIKNGTVYNIPDISQTTTILGSKTINNAISHNNALYVATDFGIVQISINDLVILNTFYIGQNAGILKVNNLLIHDNSFYAATQKGVLEADIDSSNLADFNSWAQLEDEPVVGGVYKKIFVAFNKLFLWNRAGDIDNIFYLEDDIWKPFMPEEETCFEHNRGMGFSNSQLWIATQNSLDFYNSNLSLIEKIEAYHYGSMRPNNSFWDRQGILWIADSNLGIVRRNVNGSFQNYIPEAPTSAVTTSLGAAPGVVWVTSGATSEGGVNRWNYSGVMYFEDEKWKTASRFTNDELESVFDIIRVTPDPGNNKQAYFSSWSRGIFRLTTNRDITLYNETNSTLQRRAGLDDQVRIGGAAFDSNRNLWVTNSEVEKPISVRKSNGEWIAFDTKGLTTPGQLMGKIETDMDDQKWVILPGNGILVFKENSLDNGNDFQVRKLSTIAGNGSLPSNYVYSLAVDYNGYMWIGTQKGVAVFYNTGAAFSGEAFDAQQPIVIQDGFAGLLLENDQVNAIVVDGGNNKWFGTTRSGAFYMTPDARNTYLHFTTHNSPLPSNNILDITVEPETGEVFFATDKGLASFRNYVTVGGDKHEDVFAYPNPVRPGYDGHIAIKGLVRNAFIKITDINGNLIYETRAQGGQAIWNGRDLNGNKPSSGVYTVFSTNDDGRETAITKILFIR